MQLALNQLDAQLGKGLRALYTLHGNEPLLEQEVLDSIRRHARAQGYSERSSFTVAGAHFERREFRIRAQHQAFARPAPPTARARRHRQRRQHPSDRDFLHGILLRHY